VNEDEHTIIFGAWNINTEGSRTLILDKTWGKNFAGHKNPAFSQSVEHIRLVEEQGYKLFTFPIIFSDELKDKNGYGPAKIKGFEPILTPKYLVRICDKCYACDDAVSVSIPEEISEPERYLEGAAKTIAVNAYERNSKARAACIKHHGAVCAICNFNFETAYGVIGKGVIHVHHIIPLSEIRREYELDPIRDLIPVCPNCHTIIHLTQPTMSIEEVRSCLSCAKNAELNGPS
jgi:5-methylcytosine-specific restriction protein A